MKQAPGRGSSTRGIGGWIEAAFFALALAILNVAYAIGHQLGCHPIAFLAYAMPIAALTLLHVTGVGDDWARVIRHPLSWLIGTCLIGMEGAYYMLLKYASPADGSLLVRLNVPVSMLLGLLLLGRRPELLAAAGAGLVGVAIAVYIPAMPAGARGAAVVLGAACAVIMSIRAIATEFHPWNHRSAGILERMRVTGLVLLVTSTVGAVTIAAAMVLVAAGVLHPPDWLPTPADFLYLPTYVLALFAGGLVLTAMQYLAFSVVAKLNAETFVATTALIPLVTVAVQEMAVRTGVVHPIALDWRVLPPMLAVLAGVILVLWGARRRQR